MELNKNALGSWYFSSTFEILIDCFDILVSIFEIGLVAWDKWNFWHKKHHDLLKTTLLLLKTFIRLIHNTKHKHMVACLAKARHKDKIHVLISIGVMNIGPGDFKGLRGDREKPGFDCWISWLPHPGEKTQ